MHFQAIPEKIEVALQILVSNTEIKSKQWWTRGTWLSALGQVDRKFTQNDYSLVDCASVAMTKGVSIPYVLFIHLHRKERKQKGCHAADGNVKGSNAGP